MTQSLGLTGKVAPLRPGWSRAVGKLWGSDIGP